MDLMPIFFSSLYQSKFFLYSVPQVSIDLMMGRMDSPSSERAYSTRGGTSGNTVRVIMPSSSIERRLSVRTFWLIPSRLFCSSLKRQGLTSKFLIAAILGMTEYGVVNLEKGFNPIHYKNAVLIGKALNIDPEELMDEYTRFCLPGFGKKIKAIRAAFGVSQKDFAPIVGVDRSTVSIWEAEIDEHHPSREAYNIIKEMAKEKGVDIS